MFQKRYSGQLLMRFLLKRNNYKKAFTIFMDNEMASIFSNNSNLRLLMHTLISHKQYNMAVDAYKIFHDRKELDNLGKLLQEPVELKNLEIKVKQENFFKAFLLLTKAFHGQVSILVFIF